MISDLFIVVRTNNERTVEACKTILMEQAQPNNVAVIREKPFFSAVRKTFELGAESGTRWLLALDADILLFPRALDTICREAKTKMTDSVFRIDFPLMDKFRGKVCGTHLYNNRYSAQFVEHVDGDSEAPHYLRTESDNVVRFCKPLGLDFHRIVPDDVVGMHDYHQFYAQIFNKFTARYQRCLVDNDLDKVRASIERGQSSAPEDKDFAVAMAGLGAFNGSPDTHIPWEQAREKLGLSEKPSMNKQDIRHALKVTSATGQL